MNIERAYEVLECTPKTDSKLVEKCYKKLRGIYHPDKPLGDSEMFQLIQDAYELICNHRAGEIPDDLEALALVVLEDEFTAIINGMTVANKGNSSTDPVTEVSDTLVTAERLLREKLDNMRSRTSSLMRIKKKVTCSSKFGNMYANAWEKVHNGHVKEAILHNEFQLKVLQKAVHLLGEYQWADAKRENELPDRRYPPDKHRNGLTNEKAFMSEDEAKKYYLGEEGPWD